jgi:hypothetical protein
MIRPCEFCGIHTSNVIADHCVFCRLDAMYLCVSCYADTCHLLRDLDCMHKEHLKSSSIAEAFEGERLHHNERLSHLP